MIIFILGHLIFGTRVAHKKKLAIKPASQRTKMNISEKINEQIKNLNLEDKFGGCGPSHSCGGGRGMT